jgi:hypothetical protein
MKLPASVPVVRQSGEEVRGCEAIFQQGSEPRGVDLVSGVQNQAFFAHAPRMTTV